MNYNIVIPARFGSSRLPGKPLALIGEHPMIWHVWQRACETGIDPNHIWIATDDERVAQVARAFGAQVAMTRHDHASGSDRLAEVAKQQGWGDDTIVVNVQGDEPLLPATLIELAAYTLASHPQCGIATLACPLGDYQQVIAPQCVKVVTNQAGHALYFSRAPIPWDREQFSSPSPTLVGTHWLRHIGLYAYRVGTLQQMANLPKAPIEELESLEQLRALWHGIGIAVATVADAPPHGVDTQDDLDALRALFRSSHH